MTIALITDAWSPQVNGVVRTLQTVSNEIKLLGREIEVIHPGLFRTIACPTYPEIRLSLNVWPKLKHHLDGLKPEAIHIATEGPLGLAARHYCQQRGLPFTTSFHTKFPEYIEKRFLLPAEYSYRFLRWFHRPAVHMMVATPSLRADLEQKHFKNCRLWTRGVDISLFNPKKRIDLGFKAPIFLYIGRIAVEKNIESFLKLPIEGTKLVVGDGPHRAALEKAYPEAKFVGAKFGEELASYYASADAFVFPSLTDTFGLVMLEALASGTPVAAYPVTGPIDVITDSKVGILSDNLEQAVTEALTLNRNNCRAYAEQYSWKRCAEMLLDALEPIN